MRTWRALLLVSSFFLVSSSTRRAFADTPASTADAIEKEKTPWAGKKSYFEHAGPERFFVAGTIEGGPFLKPTVNLGWGKPHWAWVGVEGYPMATWSFANAYAGVHAGLPFLEIHGGVRDNFSYARTFLQPADRFTGEDTTHEVPGAPNARYTDAEVTARLTVPVPGGYALAQGELLEVVGAPAGTYLYEENLRVVMRVPALWATQVAYAAELGQKGELKLGLAGELLVSPARGGATTWRLGPAGQLELTDHTDLTFALTLPFAGRDDLGVVQGSFGLLALKWSFATGDPHPKFP